MVRGLPDYFKGYIAWPVIQAGKYGPVKTVIFRDDFEDTLLKWDRTGIGTYGRDTTHAFIGGACLQLTTPATAGQSSGAQRRFSFPLSKRVGLSLMFDFDAKLRYIDVDVVSYDGTTERIALVRYDVVNTKWQYFGSDGAYHDIPGGTQKLNVYYNVWHFLCLEVDFEDNEYLQLIAADRVFDLRGIAIWTASSTARVKSEIDVSATTNLDSAEDLYVDDVVLFLEPK